ncbi:MAG: hypothetical protein ACKO96_42450, partial [Flammeovirgaceae bacterium]
KSDVPKYDARRRSIHVNDAADDAYDGTAVIIVYVDASKYGRISKIDDEFLHLHALVANHGLSTTSASLNLANKRAIASGLSF